MRIPLKPINDWKSFGKIIFQSVIAFELLAVLGCYSFYRKTNRDPEFRYRLYRTPGGSKILESYYKLGETLNSELKIREQDMALWRQQGKSDLRNNNE